MADDKQNQLQEAFIGQPETDEQLDMMQPMSNPLPLDIDPSTRCQITEGCQNTDTEPCNVVICCKNRGCGKLTCKDCQVCIVREIKRKVNGQTKTTYIYFYCCKECEQ